MSESDTNRLTLRCDTCGHRVTAEQLALRWDVMWRLATDAGWAGSPSPSGEHHCPRCCTSATPRRPSRAAHPTRQERWEVDTRSVGDTAIMTLHGELDVLVCDDLRARLAWAAEHHRHLVIDLGDVTLVDSTAVGILVRSHQTVKPKGGHVCLAAPSRLVVAVLHTMRLAAVFPTFPDCRTAIDWLGLPHQ